MECSVIDSPAIKIWTKEKKEEYIKYIRQKTVDLENHFIEDSPALNDLALTEFLVLLIGKSNKVTPFNRRIVIEEKDLFNTAEESQSWLICNRTV